MRDRQFPCIDPFLRGGLLGQVRNFRGRLPDCYLVLVIPIGLDPMVRTSVNALMRPVPSSALRFRSCLKTRGSSGHALWQRIGTSTVSCDLATMGWGSIKENTYLCADACMLSFVKIRGRRIMCSVKAAVPDQSPLVDACSGILEEVVHQNLVGLEIYDIPYPARPTSSNSRPLLSYNVLE